MTWLTDFWRSSIGGKVTMAVTGFLLFGFVVAHLVGNLQLLAGPEAINGYAKWLHDRGALLWVARIGLLAVFVVHVVTALRLARANKVARPVAYAKEATIQASFASRSMVLSGVSLLVFVIYHLLHLTTGQAHRDFVQGDVYHNLVSPLGGFQVWWIAAVYIIANLALGLHLYHGVWAMFGSLGLTSRRFETWRRNFATAFAVIITVANVSFPLAVLSGLVR